MADFVRLFGTMASLLVSLLLATPSAAQVVTTYGYDALGRVGWVNDGDGLTARYDYDPAGNRLEVQTAADDGGFPPIAVADGAVTRVSNPIQIYVLTNDFSPEGRTMTVTAVTTPDGGTATIGAGGAYVTYSPPGGLSGYGEYGFGYTVTDSEGKSDDTGVGVRVMKGEGYCYQFPDDPWCS